MVLPQYLESDLMTGTDKTTVVRSAAVRLIGHLTGVGALTMSYGRQMHSNRPSSPTENGGTICGDLLCESSE